MEMNAAFIWMNCLLHRLSEFQLETGSFIMKRTVVFIALLPTAAVSFAAAAQDNVLCRCLVCGIDETAEVCRACWT